MNNLPKTLIVVGALIIFAGGIAWLFNRVGITLGKLPGDISIEKEGLRLYFPWFTCLVVSPLLSLGIRLWKGLFPK
jgi:hypothetical protein